MRQPLLFIFRLVLILLPWSLFSAGCSSGNRLDLDFTGKPVYYADSRVVRNPPEVHIYPTNEVGGLKVLFVPFKVIQKMDNPEMIGYSLSRAVWQTWSAMQVFEQFEFMAEAGPFRRDLALAYAKARNADMLVGGFVTHVFAGGNSADNRVALQIEAYDVNSGLQVWSVAQSGALPAPQTRDYLVFAVKNRLPADPLYAVTAALAVDMGEIMLNWIRKAE
ncbi:MAG: hypothetical protein LBQ63_02885 [Deltaproteobacteria bacterium]|jgi:hypothetical protein|nr:hypothetical protein [Deltaproteobacteria bacterium]